MLFYRRGSGEDGGGAKRFDLKFERRIGTPRRTERRAARRRKRGRSASTSGPSVGGDRGVLLPRVGSKIRNRPHYILFVRFVTPQFSLRRRFFSRIAPFFDKKSYFVEDAVRKNNKTTPVKRSKTEKRNARFAGVSEITRIGENSERARRAKRRCFLGFLSTDRSSRRSFR